MANTVNLQQAFDFKIVGSFSMKTLQLYGRRIDKTNPLLIKMLVQLNFPSIITTSNYHASNYFTHYIEIPRCNPPNITAERITSNSAWISWLWLRLPKTSTPHKHYSVSITTEDKKTQYFNTTEQTSVFVANLLPYRKYFYTVKAIDLTECFEGNLKLMFRSKEAGT